MSSEKRTLKLDKKTSKILKFLKQWQDDQHLYNFQHIHSMEFHDGEWLNILDDTYFGGEDLTPYFKDRFWSFAVDGGGGEYALWFYPGLDKEAPVVFFGSEGDMEMLAASMEEFLNRIVNDITFCGGWSYDDTSPKEIQEHLENQYDDLAELYEAAHGVALSQKKVAKLFTKEREAFIKKAKKIITLHSDKKLLKNMKKQPNFIQWVGRVMKKAGGSFFVSKDPKNTQLQKAHKKAKKSLDIFINSLKAKKGRKYMLKLHFADPFEKNYYAPIWIEYVRYHKKRKEFSGILSTVPIELEQRYNTDERIRFHPKEVYDWMFKDEKGLIHGAFTLRLYELPINMSFAPLPK